jgi:excisionase family DNA binding protein
MSNPNIKQTETLLTQAEIAEVLGVCQETVSRLTVSGRIPFIPIGRRAKRYDREAVVVALSAYLKAPAKPTAL